MTGKGRQRHLADRLRTAVLGLDRSLRQLQSRAVTNHWRINMTFARAVKPPIVVSEGGDISVFDSVESAEGYLEVPDVENAEFELFDSEGVVLHARVESTTTRILGVLEKKIVKIFTPLDGEENPERLRQMLTAFLAASGRGLNSDKLSDLINYAR
jgi:hypothetical protein